MGWQKESRVPNLLDELLLKKIKGLLELHIDTIIIQESARMEWQKKISFILRKIQMNRSLRRLKAYWTPISDHQCFSSPWLSLSPLFLIIFSSPHSLPRIWQEGTVSDPFSATFKHIGAISLSPRCYIAMNSSPIHASDPHTWLFNYCT